jgi:hypothetical protein
MRATMDSSRGARVLGAAVGLGVLSAVGAAPLRADLRPVTVDDLMALRTVVDVEISPDGESVAYALLRPSLKANRHEVALFVAAAEGGEPRRVGEGVRVPDAPLPAPRLRGSSDGRKLAV